MIEGMKVVGIYRWHDKYTCPEAASVTRKGPKVRQGQLVVLTHMSTIDYTRANKSLIVGMEDEKGDDHYYGMMDAAGVHECHLSGPVLLLPGERPIGIVVNPASSDVLYFSAHGLIYKYPEAE